MEKIIELEADYLNDKETMSSYMAELFSFPSYFGRNLDAVYDLLSEVSEDTIFTIDLEALQEIVSNEYAYRFLKMLVDACKNNPHLDIRLM